jgi:hypothetical protein
MATRLGQLEKDLNKVFTRANGPISKVGSFTGTLTGYASPPTGAVTFIVNGKLALLQLPALTGTSNATGMTLTGAPVEVRPKTAKTVLVLITNNGTAAVAQAVIGTDGVITFSNGIGVGTAFTNSGTKGIQKLQVPYSLE